MRFTHITLCVLLLSVSVLSASQHDEDNDFAEFEDFEEEFENVPSRSTQAPIKEEPDEQEPNSDSVPQSEEEVLVEDEEDVVVEDMEFDHLQDEEEFEGFDSDRVGKVDVKDAKEAKITITKVPFHLRTNWDSYYLEMLMVAGLLVYFINFFTGKSKNNKLANAWFASHRTLLDENFSLVGDDGKMENENPGLIKESENIYMLWCSGRTCCEGMLVELKFLKRQDLVAMIAQLMRPNCDQVHIKVDMNKDDMDSFIFSIASKKTAIRLSKDMADLSVYCPERKAVDKFGLPANFSMMSEIGEVSPAMLDSRVITVFNKFADLIDYIHFSDQYSGVKQLEDTSPTKLPETQKVLLFAFNLPVKGRPAHDVMEQVRPLMQLVFYCIEKVKRFRLSKEAKAKADKNRQRVKEAFMKTTHAARAEAAAARREEKKRQEKERILQEDDPDKQRKWEERENRRQMKKKAPKMKQLRVKAL